MNLLPMMGRRLCGRLLLLALSFSPLLAAPAEWVERSNVLARELIEAQGPFQPLRMTFFGIPGFDDRMPDLGPGVGDRYRAAVAAARDRLQEALAEEEHPLVRQDLQIMINAAEQDIDESLLNERFLLPYFDPGLAVFQSVSVLLANRQDDAAKRDALLRLQRATGLAAGSRPLAEQLRERYAEAKAEDPDRLAPFRREVEQTLGNRERYVQGLRELTARLGLDDAAPAIDALDAQLAEHAAWVEAEVLPAAREDFRLPRELYAQNLRSIGLDISPEELMERARLAYTEVRNELQTIAALVARERGLPDPDYRAVIRALKQEQLATEEVLPYYRQIIAQVEDIIRRERIVSLPERPMAIRLATEAESAAQPAPHMDPPPLVNNAGEMGAFVLPLGNPAEGGAEVYDDFTYKASTWTLVAHEGRPGHELQFASLVERGVSLARSFFAFNSVNVEGWALYAEAELKPYEPLEGQLIALQLRLMRAARAFLDPMLNLGLITPERAREVLLEEVVLSPGMARQEIDRYTFRSPGQATSYFYGYTQILALRTATEVELGGDFDRLAFNNFLLDQGLLPPDLLAEAVRNEFIPQAREK